MTAIEALEVMAGLGITVTVDGELVRYRPAPPDLLKPELARLKPEMLALLGAYVSPAVRGVVQASEEALGPVGVVAVLDTRKDWREQPPAGSFGFCRLRDIADRYDSNAILAWAAVAPARATRRAR